MPEITQNSPRTAILKICEENGLPSVGSHGLRHSFAGLAYHLHMPERIAKGNFYGQKPKKG